MRATRFDAARRGFVLEATAMLAALAPAQRLFAQGKLRRVGILHLVGRQAYQDEGLQKLFLQGMRDFGYTVERDFVLEERFADNDATRLPALVAELVRAGVDVIVSPGTQISLAAQKGTSTIPIVVLLDADPVANGLALSLARPGKNLTGFSTQFEETTLKNIEFLQGMVPKLTRLGVLTNPSNATMHKRMTGSIIQAAQKAGIQVATREAGIPADIEPAIGALAQEKVQAMLTLPDSVFAAQTRLIAQVALKHRLPTAGNRYQFPEAGGLFSYGMNATNNWRLGAKFVHRILQGAKPGELPFEQPTTFELVINSGTAKTLGLKVPQAMLLQATRVIE